MSRFLSELEVSLSSLRDDNGAALWVLDEALVYHSDIVGMVTVPKGFPTDFASVPRVPFIYEALGGLAHYAATIHDWLYTHPAYISREDADAVFREAAIASGVPRWKAQLMYWAIRLFGGERYNKEAKK